MRDVITDIIWHVETNYQEPNISLSEDVFEEYSYSRWVAFEILNKIMDKPHLSAENIVYDFVIYMTYMSFTTLNKMQGRLCEISIKVANDILSFIVGEEYE